MVMRCFLYSSICPPLAAGHLFLVHNMKTTSLAGFNGYKDTSDGFTSTGFGLGTADPGLMGRTRNGSQKYESIPLQYVSSGRLEGVLRLPDRQVDSSWCPSALDMEGREDKTQRILLW